MKVNFIPSLQMMACVPVAISILYEPEIQHLMYCYSPVELRKKNVKIFDMVEKMAMEKVMALDLTLLLQARVKHCFLNLFSQIIECKTNYLLALPDETNLEQLHKFVFKGDGTVDKHNTVKSLFENQNLSLNEKFLVESIFCGAQDFDSFMKRKREAFRCLTPSALECHPVVKLWIEIFEERLPCVEISDQIVESPVVQNSVAMLRYVLQNISFKKKRPYLLSIASMDDVNMDVMLFCFSQLNEMDQEMICMKYPTKILKCMLIWSYQPMLLRTVEHLWKFISKDSFCDFLWFVLNKILKQAFSDYKLIALLKEFWCESPEHLKNYSKQHLIFEPLKVILYSGSNSLPLEELTLKIIECEINLNHRHN